MNARRERIATAIFEPRVVRMHQAAPPTQSAPPHPEATDVVKQEVAVLSASRGSSSFIYILRGARVVPDPQLQVNTQLALDRLVGLRLSYNEFTNRIHLGLRGRPHEQLTDDVENRLWLQIEKSFHFRPPRDLFRAVLQDRANSNRFHPVRQYLDSLTWDGTQRLDTWLITYGGADDSEYSRAVGALMFVAAVRRVRQPGCKFDEMVVFESQQGWLKSSAVQALCVNPEWFSDCLPLSASIKEVIEQTEGKWIIEVPELAGMSGAQVEKLKAMLSRQTDSSRAAYGHHRADRPRQFILFGTTNDSEYLRDMTGNRRFWPVKLTKRFDVDGVTSARDQLWAEAAEREANGESIRMPEHLWDAAAKEQEQRLVVDPWEDEIARMLAPNKRRIQTSEIWSWLGRNPANLTKADSMRLSAVMTRLGWRRITVTNSQGHAAVGFGKDP